MKTITLTLVVPDWAKWVATDDDGGVYAFKTKPKVMRDWDAWLNDDCSYDLIGTVEPPSDFTKTLRRI